MNKQQKFNNNCYIHFYWNQLDFRSLTNIIFLQSLQKFPKVGINLILQMRRVNTLKLSNQPSHAICESTPRLISKPVLLPLNCLSCKQHAYFLPLPTLLVSILGYIASAYSLFSTQISQESLGFAVVTNLTLKCP